MTVQRSVTARDNANAGYSTAVGTTGVTLLILTGAQPANCATADSGTALATLSLPTNPLGASSAGVISKSGTWSGTASATGTAGYYRIKASGGAVQEQGTVGTSSTANTSATTAAHGAVLTFASAPAGIVVGQTISGTGVAAGTIVESISGATIVMSKVSTAGVGSAVTITFGFDMNIDNVSIASGQTVTISSYSVTAADA